MSVDPSRRITPVVRVAPAKLNLTLAVVGRRPDGYHTLHSVMAPLALGDRLSLSPDPSPEARDTLRVGGFDAGPPSDNLVLRALAATRRALRPHLALPPAALAVRLDKRIPVAAGLAGGSSDAAATIDGALEAWSAADVLSEGERAALAASIGSDVPFFFAASPALVEGRGERVTPLRGIRLASGERPPGLLLVTPDVAAHTAAVFAAWAGGAMGQPGVAARSSEHFAAEFGSGMSVKQIIERAGVLAASNDLLPAAAMVVDGLVALRRALTRLLARPIGLSGSGPTLWALYPSIDDAELAAASVRAATETGFIATPGDGRPFVAATTFLLTTEPLITLDSPITSDAIDERSHA
ncbi:MAG: 4-diphosphocytidyl-2-C-methyl-D-erythritol kinase [Chloroflexota bacterium]|jgi:4-diphosphocytidyl-2-C-methyl-D-erythritol kinase|nr:4-diphosphocytidyl-2-C-methyl-D-erythritol kinase [Chloroflexota bacterium]